MASNTSGGWIETVAPGVAIKLNPATMPHALLSNGDGTFTFKRLTWDEREAGDDKSAPLPSFVGKRLNDIFFARNRLGLLAGENVILSRAGGEFYNFFREKAVQVLDTDPIDVASTEKDISVLSWAVPFASDIMVFSPRHQLRLTSGNDPMTPKTVEVKPLSRYENYDGSAPIPAGSDIYFSMDRGEYSGVMRYSVNQQAAVAEEVTKHIPRLIPRGMKRLVSCTAENMLFALSSLEPNKLFSYSHYDNGGERVQSAWSEWTFGDDDTILDIGVFASDLVLLIQRDDGVYIEAMALASGRVDSGTDYQTHLDRRVSTSQMTLTYNPPGASNKTTVDLPYPVAGQELEVWTKVPAGSTELPRLLHHAVSGDSQITLAGDRTASDFYVGRPYSSLYEFSTPYPRSDSQSRADGRLQLRRFQAVHGRTGGYVAEVENRDRQLSVAVDLGYTADTAWDALLTYGSDLTSTSGVAFAVTPPLPLPSGWSGNYDTGYTGPLRGTLTGIPSNGRYVIRLTGSESASYYDTAVPSSGPFTFAASLPGTKSLSVVRVADGAVIHKETFETGGSSGSLLIDDEGSVLLFDTGSELALDVVVGRAAMLRGYSDSALQDLCYPKAQAMAILAALQRGDNTQAETWMLGLLRCWTSTGFPTTALRPYGTAVDSVRPADVNAWCMIALKQFLAVYPDSVLTADVRITYNALAAILNSRIVGGIIQTNGVTDTVASLLAYFGFKDIAVYGLSSTYASVAGTLEEVLVLYVWAETEGRFATPGLTQQPLEVHALGTLFMAATGRTKNAQLCEMWCEYYASSNGTALGYADFVPGLDGQGAYVGSASSSTGYSTFLVALAQSAVGKTEDARATVAGGAQLLAADGVDGSAASTALLIMAESPEGLFSLGTDQLRSGGAVPFQIARPFTYRVLEQGPAGDGKFSWPVTMQNTAARIRIKSLGALAFGLLSASWEGFFTARSQKV